VIVRTRCEVCHKPVELECRGYEGFWSYDSYNEYSCPHCGKRNVELCPGTILAVRSPTAALV
jgi:Zn finger protein HypA/HybF involved in hydrogenase expression